VNLLDVVLFLPGAGFLLLLMLPKGNLDLIRRFALFITLLTFALSLALIPGVNAGPAKMSYETNVFWVESPPIRYHVGLDGLSLWLVILSTFLGPLSVLVSWKYIQKRVKEYYAFLVFLLFGVLGVFVALDLFLFFVFWEISLVPMYFLIGIWGHERRVYAAVKFFLYTMAGSALMLVAIIWLFNKTGSFDLLLIRDMIAHGRVAIEPGAAAWLFLAFFFAFAIKVPLFPLHTWLPDAHGEAPTAGSVMLASVLLKLGTYGIVRVCLPLFPEAARNAAPWIVALAIIGIIYGALVAMVQPNMKRLVAYSSVSHLGFVILGIFTFTQAGLDGAVYQMLNHGVSTGALFILVGMLYERRHSLEIVDYGGVGSVAPWLSTIFVITTLASVGLPLLNNFVGEYLVLQGTMQVSLLWTALAALGVILSAVYMLWMVQRTFYGETPETVRHHLFDLSAREWVILVPLVTMMVWMGIGTQTFLPAITAANTQTIQLIQKPPAQFAAAPAQAPKEAADAR
jgi:NADH-quinone oxidoreductase subunit M